MKQQLLKLSFVHTNLQHNAKMISDSTPILVEHCSARFSARAHLAARLPGRKPVNKSACIERHVEVEH